jgi:outer membrane protein OmpA-like peptidoglycan-associated protein/uncharacterized protein YidB (DUF937 family)
MWRCEGSVGSEFPRQFEIPNFSEGVMLMGTMDLLINDVENHFGISDAKAGSLLSSLLGLIQQQKGGLSGFLDRFRSVGLSDMVSGWLTGATASPISPESVQSALGSQTVSSIASRTGLSLSMVTAALGYMVPRLVRGLTPGGTIPTRLPADAMSYLSNTPEIVTGGARDAVRSVERKGLPRWLWPLLALVAILLAVLLWPRGASFNIEDQIRTASAKASAALAALKPGFSAADLTSALNLEIINFSTGSAQIPDSSILFLNKAADVIKTAPSTMSLEIGGHTDNVGDPAANLALSQQRADAVRNYLISRGVPSDQLVAKGYGDTKPVASNDTDEGRFQNRRIEFTAR